jgi:hypothetical protein
LLGVLLFDASRRFPLPISETKNRVTMFYFVPDFSGGFVRTAMDSYAYEIYYVPNSSGSQSNVV